MSGRYAAVFVLSVLFAAAAAGPLWFLRGPDPEALAAGRAPARLEIRRPRENIVLAAHGDGRWRLLRPDHPADSEAVERLLGGLRCLTFSPAIAPPESAAAYGLGPADFVRARVLDSGGLTLFDGFFGRRVFGRSAYFRASERGQVRLASGLDPELLRFGKLGP